MHKLQHKFSTVPNALIASSVIGREDVDMDFAYVDFAAAAVEPVPGLAGVGYCVLVLVSYLWVFV